MTKSDLVAAIAAKSQHADVDLQLALSLGRFDDPRALPLLVAVLDRHAGDQLFADAALSGLQDREAEMLEVLEQRYPGGHGYTQKAWNNLGAVNYMLGDFEGAATAYQRAVEIAPTQVVKVLRRQTAQLSHLLLRKVIVGQIARLHRIPRRIDQILFLVSGRIEVPPTSPAHIAG